MEFYRAPRVRVADQQRNMRLPHQDFVGKSESGDATMHVVVVMDFTMKFESISARDNTQQHISKRGIGWHGFLVSYYIEGTDAVLYTVYCDQIFEGSNKQDGLAAVSMLDAFLRRIKCIAI